MSESDKSFGQKEEWQLRLEQVIRELDPNALFAAAQICDGHTIWNPEVFVRAGLPEELVNHFNRVHMSAADGKYSKWGIEGPSGSQIEACKGVYGLELLDLICEAYGIPPAPKSGRSAIVRWDIEELRKKLELEDAAPNHSKEEMNLDDVRMEEDDLDALAELFAEMPIKTSSFANFIERGSTILMVPKKTRVAIGKMIRAHRLDKADELLQLFKHPGLAKFGKTALKNKDYGLRSESDLEIVLVGIAEKIYELLRKNVPSLPQRSWRPEEVETKEEFDRVRRESVLAGDIIDTAITKILGVDPGEL